MSKLQNIKAVREMLAGEHRTQTRKQFAFNEKSIRREIGDKWEEYDENGNIICIWEQKDGYRLKTRPITEIMAQVRNDLQAFPNCLHDKCKTKKKTALDYKFRALFGRCANCQFEVERDMKLNGTYKDYEKQRMLNNAKAFFENHDSELNDVVKYVSEGGDYVNSDGTIEHWQGSTEVADKMKEQYLKYKDYVLKKLKDENDI